MWRGCGTSIKAGVDTIFPARFVREVIGLSCLSVQAAPTFVPVLSCSEILDEAIYMVQMSRCWQRWGLRGGLCGEWPGLPHARHSCFQLPPTDPPGAQPSPAATTAVPLENRCKERQNVTQWMRGRARETSLQTLKSENEEGRRSRRDSAAALGEEYAGAGIRTAARVKDCPQWCTGVPCRSCGLWKAHPGAGLACR